MAGEDGRFGISVETGGRLTKDRRLFYFGKRVEGVIVANGTSSAITVDVQVSREPVFYVQTGRSESVAVEQETYFYFRVPANDTRVSPPFFARRGLVLKGIKSPATGGRHVWGGAIVHGIQEGEAKTQKVPS